jgi:hypothetical protein
MNPGKEATEPAACLFLDARLCMPGKMVGCFLPAYRVGFCTLASATRSNHSDEILPVGQSVEALGRDQTRSR